MRSWMPCQCATAVDLPNGVHGHQTWQCYECRDVLYEPACPEWDAQTAYLRPPKA
jgi:hypothetical protein